MGSLNDVVAIRMNVNSHKHFDDVNDRTIEACSNDGKFVVALKSTHKIWLANATIEIA